MNEPNVVTASARRPKIQRWTRKKLYRTRAVARKEAKALQRGEYKQAQSRARKEAKLGAPFEGCDPARTERLADEKS